MIRVKRFLPLFLALTTALNINTIALAAPSEQTSQVITRSSNSNQVTARLLKQLALVL